MFTRAQKEQQVVEIKERLDKSCMVILTEYQGMKVKSLNGLRRKLKKEAASEYKVYKNTLIKRALEESNPLLEDNKNLKGPNGIVFSYEDPAATAKALYEVAKEDKSLKIKIGVMDNKILSPAELETLSKLPSRDELLGQVAATMQAPISGFVKVCAGVIRGFVNCVNEVKKQKEEQA